MPPQVAAGQIPPPVATPSPSVPPTFLNRELPKVGLILGPGAMKAYSHLGVLREFARARIGVHALVGIEWGAVMGALYAMKGQVNEAEWKAFKLRQDQLPEEGGFLSKGQRPVPIARALEFLETAFGDAVIERSKIDFACPAYWSHEERFGFMSRGPIKEALRACLPFPPLYQDNAGVYAEPFSLDETINHLRGRGANLIVLVNVVGQGEFFESKDAEAHATDILLWSEIRREMLRARPPGVHFVINVNTTGHPLDDFTGRRALLESGAKAASEIVNKLVSQYGF